MATFGSYGNLGGELVNIAEVNVSTTSGTQTVSYTVPAGRYALVVIRSVSMTAVNFCRIIFNYSSNDFIYESSATQPVNYSVNYPSFDNANDLAHDFQPKLMNEGETIEHLAGALGTTAYNFLIFEYRKP